MTYSQGKRQAHLHLTDPMTSKSINVEEGAKPIHGPIYSLSPPELTALWEFLKEHTRNGFICPSKSPWGSPILFVKKKDGSLRLVNQFLVVLLDRPIVAMLGV